MKITAISGSLRDASSNKSLLRALAALAPDGVNIAVFQGIDELPFFSPERDIEPAHSAVARLRNALRAADAIMISTPEYAHSIPGSLKNALDWVVGSGELSQKPVAAISASPSEDGGSHAHASLIEILATMDARVISEASPAIGYIRVKLDKMAADFNEELTRCLQALCQAVP